MNISVIIPTYNRADLVCEAVHSVLRQKAPADEIWVLDDGSTDDTVVKLSAFADSINIHQQPNRGVSAARNAGIKRSRCEWLAFLDSDDLWKPKKLLRQKEELAQNPGARLCYTDEEWRKNDRWKNQKIIHSKYSGWIYDKCLPLCIISPSSALMHRSVFDAVGLFDESLPACEDYDLWLRVCSRFPALYLPEKLIVKRAGAWEQLSQQHSLDKYRIQALVKRLHSGELTEEQSAVTKKMLEEKCRIYAMGCEKHGRHEELAWLESMKTVTP
jgi:glycosyltransferase involved in cell wall biosynthesis